MLSIGVGKGERVSAAPLMTKDLEYQTFLLGRNQDLTILVVIILFLVIRQVVKPVTDITILSSVIGLVLVIYREDIMFLLEIVQEEGITMGILMFISVHLPEQEILMAETMYFLDLKRDSSLPEDMTTILLVSGQEG